MLVLILAIFIAPFAGALYLYYTNWQPGSTKNRGELIHPVRDLRAVKFTQTDGKPFTWHHEDHVWSLFVAPPAQCDTSCDKMADTLRRIWIGLGHNASNVRVVWVGSPPKLGFRALIAVHGDTSLAERLPDVAHNGAIPIYLVDPSGYLFMRYTPGFNPGDIRRDLAQLLAQQGM